MVCLPDTALPDKKGLVEDSPQSFACFVVSVSLTSLAFEKKMGDFLFNFLYFIFYKEEKQLNPLLPPVSMFIHKASKNH